jgi:hypothetical protein
MRFPLWLSCTLFVIFGSAHAAENPALRSLISQADLHYPGAMERSEDGVPIGTGRMGSLVWTTPSSLRFQINRNDVQAISGTTTSFYERNSDYVGGCAFVDIELGFAGGDVFTRETPQHLSVYNGLLTLQGSGLTARIVALPTDDLFAIEIDDRRAAPQPIAINLRMLRHAAQYSPDLERLTADHVNVVRTRQHTALSQLGIRDGRIVLRQEFREADHAAGSAVAIAILARDARGRFVNETTVSLEAPAAGGTFTVLISSAASLGPTEDAVARALRTLDVARSRTFAACVADTGAWWHQFWARGSIALHSADGVADEVAAHYHYFLYLMAAASRGKYPPKFNGMLWNTAGDLRTWGAQHWFANLSCYYEALFAANRLELLDPMFDLYFGLRESAALAARQQWGSEGLFIPETVWFDGLARLPDDIAAEMRSLYLMQRPWSERSARFLAFATTKHPHSSRWNWWQGGTYVEGRWTPTERGNGPFGPVTHILGTTAKVAYLFWRRYEYTLDREWLRTRAYPMLRGAAEFYRHFPNLRRDDQGVFHLHHTNSNESVQDVRDSDEDLAAMRGVLAAAIKAGDLIGADAELRREWSNVLARLAPLPLSSDADALKPDDYQGPAVFVRGRKPVVSGRGFLPDGNSLPQWFFDLCNQDPANAANLAFAGATFDRAMRGAPPNAETRVGVLSKWAIAGTTLGRVEATRFLIPNQIRSLAAEREGAYRGGRPLANRLSLREGHQAFDAQRIGRAAEALQIALLDSSPAGPARDSTLRLFSAWPADWDATFTLRARGGFVVTASQKNGRVTSLEILSETGAPLRLRNPWPGSGVIIESDQRRLQLSEAVLEFPTQRGERVKFRPH